MLFGVLLQLWAVLPYYVIRLQERTSKHLDDAWNAQSQWTTVTVKTRINRSFEPRARSKKKNKNIKLLRASKVCQQNNTLQYEAEGLFWLDHWLPGTLFVELKMSKGLITAQECKFCFIITQYVVLRIAWLQRCWYSNSWIPLTKLFLCVWTHCLLLNFAMQFIQSSKYNQYSGCLRTYCNMLYWTCNWTMKYHFTPITRMENALYVQKNVRNFSFIHRNLSTQNYIRKISKSQLNALHQPSR